jgi:hypothetical protein
MLCPRLKESRVRQTRATVRGLALGLVSLLGGCGENGLFPSTVDQGADFNVADVVFDENFFYCRVEPELFAHSCGPGDQGLGDAANGCHYNVTSFRLSDYAPLVFESCNGGVVPSAGAPAQARQNYQVSQARMDRVPERARLFTRPTQAAQHPRKIFEPDSQTADVIRDWATKFSTQ